MPVIDLAFPLRATKVPRDHGYALFSAVSRRIPSVHGGRWLGIHPLSGQPVAEGLTIRAGAHLRLRLPAERIPEVLPLAGQTLDVAGATLSLGIPQVFQLVPAATLDARLVVVKVTRPPLKGGTAGEAPTIDVQQLASRVDAELHRQLARMDVAGQLTLCGRQRIAVAGKRVVGFSVRVAELSPQGSLRLQEEGLGGKRAMGCGLFRPTRG